MCKNCNMYDDEYEVESRSLIYGFHVQEWNLDLMKLIYDNGLFEEANKIVKDNYELESYEKDDKNYGQKKHILPDDYNPYNIQNTEHCKDFYEENGYFIRYEKWIFIYVISNSSEYFHLSTLICTEEAKDNCIYGPKPSHNPSEFVHHNSYHNMIIVGASLGKFVNFNIDITSEKLRVIDNLPLKKSGYNDNPSIYYTKGFNMEGIKWLTH